MFDICIHLGNHHHNQNNEHICHTKNFLVAFFISPHTYTNPLSPFPDNHGSSVSLYKIIYTSEILYIWNYTEFTHFLTFFTQHNHCYENHPHCHVYWWLSRSYKSGYPHLIPDIIRKIQLNIRIPKNFKYILFIRLRKFPSNFSLLKE